MKPLDLLSLDPELPWTAISEAVDAAMEAHRVPESNSSESQPFPKSSLLRGKRIVDTLLVYIERDGDDATEVEPFDQYVRDLITDLLHLGIFFKDWDVRELIERGIAMFETEEYLSTREESAR